MTGNKKDIFVYAHWKGMPEAVKMGVLSAHEGKGRKSFSFQYSIEWLKSKERFLLDPDIGFYSGDQFPVSKDNFGVFLDSMPDTWGRTLMKRRNSIQAKEAGIQVPKLYDVDYLLGVYDESRMGALRFKLDEDGEFLDNSDMPAPLWSSIKVLQHSAGIIESDRDDEEVKKWLSVLMAPGSSLGGARPKANILDDYGHPWIAKFPSKNDIVDKAKWEYLVYRLALKAGVNMTECKIERIAGKYYTFFTRRFDREEGERLHFSSAMTMTGNNEDTLKEAPASYLDIAEFIQYKGANAREDLRQLWRRIIFNISISNTDDHLRNHGFILTNKGWTLSPAYDINPSVDRHGLSLNIDSEDNSLDFELAKSVGEYYQLDERQMDELITQVTNSVSKWKQLAKEIGISRSEIEIMETAFIVNS